MRQNAEEDILAETAVISATSSSEVRIFRTKVQLADISQYPRLVVKGGSLVPVYSEDGRLLGHAGVEQWADRLVANIEIDYHSEERLLAETRAERLWAWVVGELRAETPYVLGLTDNGSAGIDLSYPARSWLRIDEIVISRKAPHDQAMGRFVGGES